VDHCLSFFTFWLGHCIVCSNHSFWLSLWYLPSFLTLFFLNIIIILLPFLIVALHEIATCQWFSPGTPVSSTNKTDHNDIAEILLTVALNTTKQTIIIMCNRRSLYVVLTKHLQLLLRFSLIQNGNAPVKIN
jgi:hypothetical protein